MSEQTVSTKAGLLADIERTWQALNAGLDRLTEPQLSSISDAQGWTVKDHLIHLAHWERSMTFLLQGKPRHAGLEVPEAVYDRGDDDEINAAIYERHKAMPAAEARAQLRLTHQQLMALIQPLSDADLQKSYHHFLPIAEHLGWIEALADGTA